MIPHGASLLLLFGIKEFHCIQCLTSWLFGTIGLSASASIRVIIQLCAHSVVRIHLLCHKTLKSNNIHKTYRRKAEQIRTNNTNSNKIVVKCAKLCKSYKQRKKLCNDEKSKGKKQNLKRNLQRARYYFERREKIMGK